MGTSATSPAAEATAAVPAQPQAPVPASAVGVATCLSPKDDDPFADFALDATQAQAPAPAATSSTSASLEDPFAEISLDAGQLPKAPAADLVKTDDAAGWDDFDFEIE